MDHQHPTNSSLVLDDEDIDLSGVRVLAIDPDQFSPSPMGAIEAQIEERAPYEMTLVTPRNVHSLPPEIRIFDFLPAIPVWLKPPYLRFGAALEKPALTPEIRQLMWQNFRSKIFQLILDIRSLPMSQLLLESVEAVRFQIRKVMTEKNISKTVKVEMFFPRSLAAHYFWELPCPMKISKHDLEYNVETRKFDEVVVTLWTKVPAVNLHAIFGFGFAGRVVETKNRSFNFDISCGEIYGGWFLPNDFSNEIKYSWHSQILELKWNFFMFTARADAGKLVACQN